MHHHPNPVVSAELADVSFSLSVGHNVEDKPTHDHGKIVAILRNVLRTADATVYSVGESAGGWQGNEERCTVVTGTVPGEHWTFFTSALSILCAAWEQEAIGLIATTDDTLVYPPEA